MPKQTFATFTKKDASRKFYPFRIKKKLNEFAALLSVTHSDFHLVTVKNQTYCVYQYEGKLNSIENAVILFSYPEKHLGTRRLWQLMSQAHFMCVAGPGEIDSFENGYHQICDIIQLEKYHYIFQCAKESHDFGSFMKYVA